MSPSQRKKDGKQVHLTINVKEERIPLFESLQEQAKRFDVEFTSYIWHILERFNQNPSKPTNLPSRKEKKLAALKKAEERVKRIKHELS